MKKIKYVIVTVLLFVLGIVPVKAVTTNGNISLGNNITSLKQGSYIYVDHTVTNDKNYLNGVNFINIFDTYDDNYLEVVGVISYQSNAYCSYKKDGSTYKYIICQVLDNDKFTANSKIAATVYRVKKDIDKDIIISSRYNSNKSTEASPTVSLTINSNSVSNVDQKQDSVKVTKLEAKNNLNIKVSEVVDVPVVVEPSAVKYSALNFSSSDVKVAYVTTDGKIFARKAGKAKITVSSGGIKTSFDVVVKDGKTETATEEDNLGIVTSTAIVSILITLILVFIFNFFRNRKNRVDDTPETYIGE